MKLSVIKGTAAGVAIGLSVGVCVYTFVYAKGGSYLVNNPAACANCHIMRDHFDAWLKSSHRSVATCNDCHTPDGLIGKYYSKAENGFWHSLAFTTGRHPDPIRIKPHNKEIVEAACRKCHGEIVSSIETPHHGPHQPGGGKLSCVQCHDSVGHMK